MTAADDHGPAPRREPARRAVAASAVSTEEAIAELRRHARSLLRLEVTERQQSAFAWYLDELRRWNARHNLTAVADPIGIVVRHFLDSLTLLPLLGAAAAGRLVDIGTGAGFPGLPLRIVCDTVRLTLVEATGKKAEFCRHVAGGLGLSDVVVLHARAEEVGHLPGHRQGYDVAAARAVASLPTLLEYLLPLLRVGGRALVQKGEHAPVEVQQAGRALEILGGRLVQVHRVELPGVADSRFVVEIEKSAATPEGYPRRAGVPGKRPLG